MKPEQSYYVRYCATAKKYEAAGTLILAAAILVDMLTHSAMFTLTLLAAGAGAILLAIGGASLRPHNAIKSFASQMSRQPSDEFAQGLLDALTANKKVQLVPRSIQMVESAIVLYAQTDDADEEILTSLRTALENRVIPKKF